MGLWTPVPLAQNRFYATASVTDQEMRDLQVAEIAAQHERGHRSYVVAWVALALSAVAAVTGVASVVLAFVLR